MRLIAALLATAGLLTAACSNEDPSPKPTATAEATGPTATPTPESPSVLMDLPVRTLQPRDNVPLPEGVVLYLESGCWQCDLTIAALQRAYRSHDGEVRIEDLYRLPGATVREPTVDGEYITSIAADDDGSAFLIGVCDGGASCGGIGDVNDDARVRFPNSADGGITWKPGATVAGGAFVEWASGGALDIVVGVITRHFRANPAAEWQFEYAHYPSLETQPFEFRGQDPSEAYVVTGRWPLLRDADGVRFYHLQGAPTNPPTFDFSALPAGSTVIDARFAFQSNDLFVTWQLDGSTYSGFTDHIADKPATFSRIFRWPAGSEPSVHPGLGSLIGEDQFVVSIPFGNGQVPAIVDFAAFTISPIEELVERARDGDRQFVKAVDTGTFAVVSGAGEDSCLNVRERPELGAASFQCYADGVLLSEIGSRTTEDGHEWLYVRTPSDREGWVSAEFLETSGEAQALDFHPVGTRTGNADVDGIIAALERSNEIRDDIIQWTMLACVVEPAGLGAPPTCPAGVAGGTEVPVLPGGACHGYYRVRGEEDSGHLAIGPEDRLHAVIPGSAPESYVLIYMDRGGPIAKTVSVVAGKIVADFGGCGHVPSDFIEPRAIFSLPNSA
jgi:hypothetical protein